MVENGSVKEERVTNKKEETPIEAPTPKRLALSFRANSVPIEKNIYSQSFLQAFP